MNFNEIRIEKVCNEKDRYKLFLWETLGNDCFVSASQNDLIRIRDLLNIYLEHLSGYECPKIKMNAIGAVKITVFL
jgi:hypothetical protein